MKPKNRRLKSAQHELMALIDYLTAEAYETGNTKAYRLRMPYKHGDKPEVQMIIEVAVYFDGEMSDERTKDGTKFKAGRPGKKH